MFTHRCGICALVQALPKKRTPSMPRRQQCRSCRNGSWRPPGPRADTGGGAGAAGAHAHPGAAALAAEDAAAAAPNLLRVTRSTAGSPGWARARRGGSALEPEGAMSQSGGARRAMVPASGSAEKPGARGPSIIFADVWFSGDIFRPTDSWATKCPQNCPIRTPMGPLGTEW